MIRFMLLGHGRNGSTLMARSLVEHPNVRMYAELFHYNESERQRAFRAAFPNYQTDEEFKFYQDGEDAAAFLDQAVYRRRYPGEISAVGFKMFYKHARQDGSARRAWDYLIAERAIHVIHLRRANLLESWLSLQIALLTKEWARPRNSNRPAAQIPPLSFTPEECETYFNQMTVNRQWAAARFKEHPLLEIEYERDLCGCFEATMQNVHDFLQIPRRRAEPLLEKQARRRPKEQISNYDELKEYFRHTLHESYFE